jgi:hypothetical protein
LEVLQIKLTRAPRANSAEEHITLLNQPMAIRHFEDAQLFDILYSQAEAHQEMTFVIE